MKHKYKKGQFFKIVNKDSIDWKDIWGISYLNDDGTYCIYPARGFCVPHPVIEEKYLKKLNIFEYIIFKLKGFRIEIHF